jgi:hypothetical protein
MRDHFWVTANLPETSAFNFLQYVKAKKWKSTRVISE